MGSNGTSSAPPSVIGVDVGGTKTLAVRVELRDGEPPEVVDSELVASEADSDAAIARIEQVVGSLLARSPAPPYAIGVGLAGFVDRSGIVRSAPNTPGLVDVDVAGHLQSTFELPTVVDNDANCVAVATHSLAEPTAQSLVAVTLGTGIGGGLVIGGHLLRGANGFAGEPGHMVVDPDGPLCPCGQRGCWERYASGTGLERLARIAIEAGHAPGVLAAAGSIEDVRGEHVTSLLESGDPGALAIFEEFVGWVAVGIANLLVLLDPEVVVIGGGLSHHGALLLELLTRELDSDFPAAVQHRVCRILVTPEGPEAGAVGAAVLAAHRSNVVVAG